MKAEIAAPGGVEALEHSAQLDARKAMNALQTIAHALKSAIAQPDAQSDHFQALLTSSKDHANRFLIRCGVNPEDKNNRWLVNMAEKTLLPLIDLKNPMSDGMLDALVQAAAARAVDLPENNAWANDTMITLAIFRGMSLLGKAQRDFDFGRKKKEDDLAFLRDMALRSCVSAMNDLCPELAPHPERVTFFVILLDQAFALLEEAWRSNTVKAQHALTSITKDQLKAWRAANPDGFSLDPIVGQFEQNFTRLLRLTLAARKADRSKK